MTTFARTVFEMIQMNRCSSDWITIRHDNPTDTRFGWGIGFWWKLVILVARKSVLAKITDIWVILKSGIFRNIIIRIIDLFGVWKNDESELSDSRSDSVNSHIHHFSPSHVGSISTNRSVGKALLYASFEQWHFLERKILFSSVDVEGSINHYEAATVV